MNKTENFGKKEGIGDLLSICPYEQKMTLEKNMMMGIII
jgi:hypothetical protein